jgi:hypothetical protein
MSPIVRHRIGGSARGLLRAAALAGLLLAPGCDPNTADSRLVPTGLRPRPAVGEGAVVGTIVFDPTQAPDLASGPYPLTIVDLVETGGATRRDTLDPATRQFEFRGLTPGTYAVFAEAYFFRRASLPPVRVVAGEMNVGSLTLPFNPVQSADIHLVGDFNGFSFVPFAPDDSTGLEQRYTGLWYGPNLTEVFLPSGDVELPDTAITLSAGVHPLRFITDFDLDNPSDYGGSSSVTLDAPLSFAPMRKVSGPATNLSIRIPVTGRYRFTVDERRLTFSIEQLP